MRRSLLALVPLLACAVASPARAAAPVWEADCGWELLSDRTGLTDDPYHHHGVVSGYAYAADETGPVGITVECWYTVEGEEIARLVFGGDGVAAGAEPVEHTGSGDVVTCWRVTLEGAPPPTGHSCTWSDPTAIPPYEVVRLGYDVVDATGLTDEACALTASVPDVGRVVRSDDDGDLYYGETPAWDCP